MMGMWKAFHHPDLSFPVVRRRIGLELLEMLGLLGDMAAHGAWAFLRNRSYPNRTAYYQAVDRLAKQGLVVKGQGLDTPQLKITEAGRIRWRPILGRIYGGVGSGMGFGTCWCMMFLKLTGHTGTPCGSS